MRRQGRSFMRVGLVFVSCAGLTWLAGCAGTGAFFQSHDAKPPFIDKNMSLQEAQDVISIGRTTKAAVLAALGPATVVRFDSGYEVWVYREKLAKAPTSGASGAEFVVLFAPSGTVKKTRIRPTYNGL